MGRGKVWLVGAGPGDAGLFTLRGREVLERAEVVVFDRLVGDGVLALAPDSAELVDVGKEGGHHPVPQREIEEVLVSRALEGQRVVRLKGGDPFVFGRGGEELEALLAHGIPFEVVPGVTSALAAPSCVGIPPTHRGLSQSVHIITGHTRSGGVTDLDYGALARLDGTLVFLMGLGNLREICERLTQGGLPGSTPAAVVERGATARQRRVTGTLATLGESVASAGLAPPAVIIVGLVVALADSLDWKSFLPLAFRRVIVTRPRGRAGRLSRMLRDEGAEVVELPCIVTETRTDVSLPDFKGFDWVVFTSASGVESFFELLRLSGRDVRELGDARLAAVGPATRDALETRGLCVDLVPDVYDGAHLGRALADRGAKRALLLRAEDGARGLTEALSERGVGYEEVPLYRTRALPLRFVLQGADAAVFTSASTVRAFCASCPFPKLRDIEAVCIGPTTAEAAREAGFVHVTTAREATLEALLDALRGNVSA
ncbi:MAG: uroporphyrinogen-III C-methyltransferase [Fretibacterium sp.]|nr:uroporphyrinogen-III C-methyltransferase [Fretibacterium sp.]